LETLQERTFLLYQSRITIR